MDFKYGAELALMSFLFGTQLPVRQLIKASKGGGRSMSAQGKEPRIDPKTAAEFHMKQELLPVTNCWCLCFTASILPPQGS